MTGTTILPPPPAAAGAPTDQVQPPGERYFRHPGDVVRLVIWGLAALLLGVFLRLAPDTSDGLTSDLGRAASRVAANRPRCSKSRCSNSRCAPLPPGSASRPSGSPRSAR